MADERVITMAKQLIKHSVRLQPGDTHALADPKAALAASMDFIRAGLKG